MKMVDLSNLTGILKDWGYRYFRDNLSDFRNWLDLYDRLYNGGRLPLDDYLSAMEEQNDTTTGEDV